MKRDPIVEDIHRIRENMWDECGGSLDGLIESLRASESEHRDRIASPAKLKQMRDGSDAATCEDLRKALPSKDRR